MGTEVSWNFILVTVVSMELAGIIFPVPTELAYSFFPVSEE